jgi:hypothetical protein
MLLANSAGARPKAESSCFAGFRVYLTGAPGAEKLLILLKQHCSMRAGNTVLIRETSAQAT